MLKPANNQCFTLFFIVIHGIIILYKSMMKAVFLWVLIIITNIKKNMEIYS